MSRGKADGFMVLSVGLPGWLKPYFWDVSLKDLDIRANRVYIIERLLNDGDQETLKWLSRTYTEEEIRDAVVSARGLTLKTLRCWQNYFDLREEVIRCIGTRLTDPGKLY